MAALEPFRCATSMGGQQGQGDDPCPLDYLTDPEYGSYDINLEVGMQADGMAEPAVISSTNFRHMVRRSALPLPLPARCRCCCRCQVPAL